MQASAGHPSPHVALAMNMNNVQKVSDKLNQARIQSEDILKDVKKLAVSITETLQQIIDMTNSEQLNKLADHDKAITSAEERGDIRGFERAMTAAFQDFADAIAAERKWGGVMKLQIDNCTQLLGALKAMKLETLIHLKTARDTVHSMKQDTRLLLRNSKKDQEGGHGCLSKEQENAMILKTVIIPDISRQAPATSTKHGVFCHRKYSDAMVLTGSRITAMGFKNLPQEEKDQLRSWIKLCFETINARIVQCTLYIANINQQTSEFENLINAFQVQITKLEITISHHHQIHLIE
jgi:hypothetical protein